MVLILTNHMLSNLGDIEWFVSSITQISPIALEASSSNEIEGKIDEDDEYEAQVEREKDEVEHDEIKENILRQSQQVVHPGQSLKIFLLSDGGEGGGWKTKLCFNYQKVPTATADFSSRPAMILLHCSTAPLQHQSSGRQNWPFAAEPQPDRQTGLDWSWSWGGAKSRLFNRSCSQSVSSSSSSSFCCCCCCTAGPGQVHCTVLSFPSQLLYLLCHSVSASKYCNK